MIKPLFACVALRVISQYLMYRPANSVPYATVEAYFEGDFLSYCMMDAKGKLMTQTVSEVEQKCNTFQHWIYQWTHGNLLVTRLEGKPLIQGHNQSNHLSISENENIDSLLYFYFSGVETKITNVRVVTKSKGFVSKPGNANVIVCLPLE